MKKLLIFFLALISPCFAFYLHQQYSTADEIIYAKVDSDNNIFLYSSPNGEDKFRLFVLPESYFVKLINEANDDFYYCSYKDIKGYVKKSDVVAMKGTPVQPYVEGLFRIFSLEGSGLYTSPQMSSEKMATIPYLTDDLIYYGEIIGQEAIPDKSDKWIYCKYNSESSLCGYVYSVFCDKVPIYTENTERFEVVSNPFVKTTKPSQLSPVATGFIITAVALPCLIVLFLLVKPTLLKDKLNVQKPKLRAKRNRDYFEFDDSDLN